ncbi:arylsulfatase [Galbibacter sp. PAP.153]|uniref:arylsulfatase n=1 Tax=Galbibacter sp. PAP.153 TaxID=3104623 RepID=UPI00300A0E46
MLKYICPRYTGFLLITGILLLSGCKKSSEKKASEDKRPNIVIVMADDMGFSDAGCYGGEIHTPNLDKLAENGLRFNAFYNTSRCCPSRASLLTGLYSHQAGIGRMTMDQGQPGYKGYLGDNTVTIAEVLKKVGYQTGMVGKWHVSQTNELESEKQLKWLAHQENYGAFSDTATYPTHRGFDKYYGNIWGVVDYFDPFSLVNGDKQVMDVPKDYYHTNAIGDSSVAYVKQFSKQKEPFFLYVAHCAPHWPIQAPEDVIAKYDSIYTKGWRAIRQARYKRLIEKGVLKSNVALSNFMFPEKKWNENQDKVWDAKAMAVHAAMVDILDKNIGKLVDQLEAEGELDNTVIFFLSDNGASSERPSKYGPGFDRAGSTRDGRTVIFPVEKDSLPGSQTVLAGIGPVWANVANTPFRYWKAQEYEGGITTPFIVHWPKGIKEKGAVREQSAHVVDLMATCIDLAGATYPKSFKEHEITPTEGNSILPIITENTAVDSTKVYFWEHFGGAALRKGSYKLVRHHNDTPWELYNLTKDRTETTNIAQQFPGIVKEMEEIWNQRAKELKVFPAP